jgi:hypothetical protein
MSTEVKSQAQPVQPVQPVQPSQPAIGCAVTVLFPESKPFQGKVLEAEGKTLFVGTSSKNMVKLVWNGQMYVYPCADRSLSNSVGVIFRHLTDNEWKDAKVAFWAVYRKYAPTTAPVTVERIWNNAWKDWSVAIS